MSDFTLRKASNYIEAEGILESSVIEEKTFEGTKKDTNEKFTIEKLQGEVIVAVDDITKVKFKIDVNKFKSNGEISKVYEKVLALRDNYVSRASCADRGEDVNNADKVKIKGTFDHKDHLNKDGTEFWSYGFYNFSFCERVKDLDFKPHAKFDVEMFCENIEDEKKDDVPTGRVYIDGIVPLYNRVIPLRLYFGATTTDTGEEIDLASWIKEHYEVNKTTRVWGIIKGEVYSSEAKTNIVGASQTFESVAIRLIPTSIEGEQYAVTDIKNYTKDDIKAAMNARQEMIDNIKAKMTTAGTPTNTAVGGSTPAGTAPSATAQRTLNW